MLGDTPILNNPYLEPKLHYATDAEGCLNYQDIRSGRRMFTPGIQVIPQKQGTQPSIFDVNEDGEQYGTHIINLIRKEVGKWRAEEYPNTTRITKELLEYWFLNPERPPYKKLFFAQQEAVETAIWLNEVSERSNAGNHILNLLKEGHQTVSENLENQLPRIAFKMATGSGKTVVMACLLLYHYFNRQEYRSDIRFVDCFLLVAPGITIKDRLGVLFVDTVTQNPKDINDYYRQRSLVPQKYLHSLEGLNAKLVISNYHQFEPKTLQGNKRSPFDGKLGEDGKKQEAKEDFTQVIKRLLSKFKTGSRLLVINDEAHHCYLPLEKGKNTEDENSAEENERAAVWFTGLKEMSKRFQLKSVYDLSATPYYLNGSGYTPYSLFPWVVTDFGLTEAIESGLVKIPFLPESDNTQELTMPVLRNLYEHVRSELPKKGQTKQKKEAKEKGEKLTEAPPKLPKTVIAALEQFVDHYNRYDKGIREAGEGRANLFTEPPVFIAVCNNTSVSKELYKYIAGYEFEDAKGNRIVVTGKYDVFSNYNPQTLQPYRKPPTLLIDSDALENSNQVNDDFKKVFAPEIEKFKQDYRIMHPDRSVENISDADILREVVNTVGKQSALGSHIRCVVSVSMLTEGWDANTVTHIMGLRAFGSQLLCEQVAGRALRRKSYVIQPYNKDGNIIQQKDLHRYKEENITWKFPPEYAHIIGVPFKLFKGGSVRPDPPQDFTHIEAIPKRQAEHEITFPNVQGYRIEIAEGNLEADFSSRPNFELDFTKVAVKTVMANAMSKTTDVMEVRSHKELRDAQVIFQLTRYLINWHFSDEERNPQFQKFNKLKKIVEEWYHTKLVVVGDTDQDLKRLVIYWGEQTVADDINYGILAQQRGRDKILPVLNYYNPFGSTKYVNGNTTKPVYATLKSHVNYVVADTESWEQICAKTLEELPQVTSYVKNAFLGFTIPYAGQGKDRLYYPDFIATCNAGNGKQVNLIIEVTGMNKDKQDKKWYVEHRWLPAVNGIREKYGMNEWHFIEVSNDIRNIKQQLSNKINSIIENPSQPGTEPRD
ncbi:DEAD/DEAH box helicase family protein [Paraflavisolibacter sp. H34]|uniref:BPTD_3080 family restriction endonuclease n=1 Tax=Huijunlia imazamoxiresistens TaxID=3127457 RepID=UPI003017509B